jgi:DNA-binding beta-propeller fold protein YncE
VDAPETRGFVKTIARIHLLALAATALAFTACGSSTEPEVRTVVVSPTSLTLKANRTVLLLATVLDGSGAQVSGVSVTFASRNPAVASTTPGGVVTGVAAGSTTIVATAGTAADSVPVVVTAGGLLTLTLSPDSVIVAAGGALPTIVQVVQDGEVVGGTYLDYGTSDPKVCTVSGTGVVTGVASGFAWVRVSAGTALDSARVVVYTPFTGGLQPRVTVPGGAWSIALSSARVLYVTQPNGRSLARFDLPGWAAGSTVTVAPGPLDVVFSANGQRAYVVSNSDQLSIVTVATGAVTSVALGASPWRVVLSADQSRLFVTTTTGTLLVRDAATGAEVASLTATSGASNGAALSADGSRLYVAAYVGGQIAEVTTATLTVRTHTIGNGLQEIVPSPDGSELYVASEGGPITVVSPATLAPIDSIPVLGTFGLLATPDGKFLVATQASAGHVVVIDRRVRRVVRDFPVGGEPRRLAYDGASATILVSNAVGAVDLIR